MKSRNKGFLIIAAIVAAVVVGVSLNYPPGKQGDAQGTIGAVQKYRSEQITNTGVVLADEKTRKSEALVYGNLLQSAAQLQSMTAELSSFSENLASTDQLAATANLASVSKSLDNRADFLGQKMLEAINHLEAQQNLGTFAASLESMEQALQSRTLDSKQLESMQQTLASMSKQLGVKNLESRNLESQSMAEAKSSLEAASAVLGSKAALESKQLESFETQLEMSSNALGQMSQMESRNLESAMQQLEMHVLAAVSVYAARAELASIENALESRADLNSSVQALENIQADLASHAVSLENKALENMESRLESRSLEAKSLESMSASLESMSQNLSNRALANKAVLANVTENLASMQKTINNMTAELAQQFALSARTEMAAISQHLDARSELSSRNLESKSLDNRNLASKSLESKALESKSLGARSLESRQLSSRNLESFAAYLGNLDQALESKSTLASRSAELGQQADALQSRVLESKSQE